MKSKNKVGHSPTPWWIDDDGFIASGSGENYLTVAELVNIDKRTSDALEANRAFIIRAVNSHEKLLGICKDILDGIRITGLDIKLAIYIDDLVDAIAKAEEGI